MSRKDQGSDPFVGEMRARINETDTEILAAVNRRLALVESLHAHKAQHGYPIVDRAREEALLDALSAQNPGPLSAAGVRELFETLIAIVTREAAEQRSRATTSPRRNHPG